MLASLIRWSADHRFLVIGFYAVLALFGLWTLPRQQTDAIPDVSDTQVIVYARWEQQPADLVEAQVTYPLTTTLLGAPQVKSVRGYSNAGYALIYVLFDDGTDLYRARTRVTELLAKSASHLPAEAQVEIGPDATGAGWIFQYALVDDSGKRSLADLRAIQDWDLRYALQSTPGVAEVAGIGGFEKEYQVSVDPDVLEDHGLTLNAVIAAVRNSNLETGGRVLDFSGRQYTVRGRGLAHTMDDLERAVVYPDRPYKSDMSLNRAPYLLRDIAHIEMTPREREGVTDLNGEGEAVGGVVVMRQGQNTPAVLRRVKDQLRNLERSLPEGVRIVPVYDRSELLGRSMQTLWRELLLAVIVVGLVILFALRHFPSSLVAVAIIPATLAIALAPMYGFRIDLNIMSLAGIILSIGILVDGAIVEVENAHRKVSLALEAGKVPDAGNVLVEAMQEVAPAVFFSLLSIAVTFLPIFALTGQEGRMFTPLAAAKTVVMVVAAALTVTLAPALRMLFRRTRDFVWQPRWLSAVGSRLAVGRYQEESRSRFWRSLYSAYEPVLRAVLRSPKATVAVAIVIALATIPLYPRLGREFMPPLNEGTVLYMPTTLPGISTTQALELLQRQDAVLASFPEVERVYGKAGRVDTSTDPAPLNMIETTIVLKPRSEWRERPRWYSSWSPEWLKELLFRRLASDRISYEDLVAEMNRSTAMPGVVNSWTMPIRGRTDMLTTGARTPVAVKVLGPDLATAQTAAGRIESVLKALPETRSVFAERPADGYYVDVNIDRDQLARYGLQMADVQQVIAGAVGGAEATEIYDGRARYPVVVRYPKEFRDSPERIGRITVPDQNGQRIPLSALAQIREVRDAGMIRTEDGRPASYVYVDTGTEDIGGYVAEAQRTVAHGVTLPPGCSIEWSGEYENMLRARARLRVVVPATLILLALLLYWNTKSWAKAALVALAVPFSLVGSVWLLYVLGYKVSVATWVGMIALMGLDAETGVFMLLYLDLAQDDAHRNGRLRTAQQMEDAVVEGAARRLRPKMMTVTAAAAGLLPTLLATGMGSEVAKRIVAPMAGGLATSFLCELLVYPPVYLLWKRGREAVARTAAAAPQHEQADYSQ